MAGTADISKNVKDRKSSSGLTSEEDLEMFLELNNEQNETFAALMNKLRNGINTHSKENKEISLSMNLLTQKYVDLVTRLDTLEEGKNTDRAYIRTLEVKLEQLERSLRIWSIEVRNVPKPNNETKADLMNIIINLAAVLNITLQKDDVRDVYRLNNRSEKKTIVVELISTALKNKLLASYKSYNKTYPTNKLNTADINLDHDPPQQIFVAENLTHQTRQLFYMAREFTKANGYRFCWVTQGIIYVRKDDESSIIKISNINDLEELKED